MHVDVVTIFPELFEPFRSTGLLGKAVERGLIDIGVHDLRSWADNRWGQVDDEPYGGGAGMVLQAPPVLRAVRTLEAATTAATQVLLLSPRGEVFDQALAAELAGAAAPRRALRALRGFRRADRRHPAAAGDLAWRLHPRRW